MGSDHPSLQPACLWTVARGVPSLSCFLLYVVAA